MIRVAFIHPDTGYHIRHSTCVKCRISPNGTLWLDGCEDAVYDHKTESWSFPGLPEKKYPPGKYTVEVCAVDDQGLDVI